MDLDGSLVSPVVDEGLGNSAYVLDLGDGRALAVDPSLDLRGVRAIAAKRGLRITYAAETHLHADFLSGLRQIGVDHEAQILASAAGRRTFPHARLDDGDEVDLGGLILRALATPGHTDEHLSFLLLDDRREIGVFTGGSLIVGGAARTDLVSPDRTDELARAQYRSVRRLTELPDDTAVWPTHGAGSYCSSPSGSRRTSTIGAEKAANPLLAAPDEDTFAARLISGLGSYPAYFARLAEVNRSGALAPDRLALVALDPDRVRRLLADGATAVDVRPTVDYAAGHLPGSVSIPLRPQFATWLGWLIPPDQPLVIVRTADQDPDDILWPALKVGYTIEGELGGGTAAWSAVGGRLRSTGLVEAGHVDATSNVVDIRQRSEHADGHLPSAYLIELGELAGRLKAVPGGPTTVMCAHGERAGTAASLLERAGRTDLSIVVGGPDDWAAATGNRLERDP